MTNTPNASTSSTSKDAKDTKKSDITIQTSQFNSRK